MFNIDLPYKRATPMKHHSCTKAGLKKIFSSFPPLGGQEVVKITASSVLYFGCSKGF
jgi:hypothetical protein